MLPPRPAGAGRGRAGGVKRAGEADMKEMEEGGGTEEGGPRRPNVGPLVQAATAASVPRIRSIWGEIVRVTPRLPLGFTLLFGGTFLELGFIFEMELHFAFFQPFVFSGAPNLGDHCGLQPLTANLAIVY